MPQRALITGISGFIGGFLAEHLLDSGDEVLGATPDGEWLPASAASLPGRVEVVAWDVGRDDGIPDEARRRIEEFRPTCIYHLAAQSVPRLCGVEEPLPAAVNVNVAGTRRVLRQAARLPSRPRVLLASSSHVYAAVDPGNPRVAETAPLGPRTPYGRTKLAAEAEVRWAVDRLGVDAVIARSFSHAGPRQDPHMLLSEWARQFAEGRDPVEVQTLDAHIDLSDARDAVRAQRLLVEYGRTGGVYNVGSGVCRRSGEVMEMLRRAAGADRRIVETAPGPKQDPIADLFAVARRTGWRPSIPLETTVADTLAWWLGRVRPQPCPQAIEKT
jgi:GDP-4-dehydro-6-deoxy-D-mannose reductase